MKIKLVGKILVIGLLVTVLLLSLRFVSGPQQSMDENNVFNLQTPPFIDVALAKTHANTSTLFLEDEAGMSAYFSTTTNINLGDVRGLYRTIETEAADYIIGSIPISNYGEDQDAHVYIHKGGWALAYYLESDPTGKIIDWIQHDITGAITLTTKLENVLKTVADTANISVDEISHYDFRYPNATNMMIISERSQCSFDSFDIKLPDYDYYERSWNLGVNGTTSLHYTDYILDNNYIIRYGRGWNNYGVLTETQLLPSVFHTITVDTPELCSGIYAYGGLVLIYKIPS